MTARGSTAVRLTRCETMCQGLSRSRCATIARRFVGTVCENRRPSHVSRCCEHSTSRRQSSRARKRRTAAWSSTSSGGALAATTLTSPRMRPSFCRTRTRSIGCTIGVACVSSRKHATWRATRGRAAARSPRCWWATATRFSSSRRWTAMETLARATSCNPGVLSHQAAARCD